MLLVFLVGVLWTLGGPGAGALLLPILVWILDIPPNLAVAAAVAVVGAVSLFDAWEAGVVSLPRSPGVVSRFLPPFLIAGGGAFLVHLVPNAVYRWALAIPLILWGVVSILSASKDRNAGHPLSETGTGSNAVWSVRAFALGFMGAPSISKGTHGDSFRLALLSGAAVFVFWRVGDFRWNAAVPALVALMVGIELGKSLVRKLPVRAGEVIFGTVLVGASIAAMVFAAMGR